MNEIIKKIITVIAVIMAYILICFISASLKASKNYINKETDSKENISLEQTQNKYDTTKNHFSEIKRNEMKEPAADFDSFMNEVQRTIRLNWHPPKQDTSKNVVVLFKVAKDGSLLSYEIKKSSGSTETDESAIQALKISAPFRPLPVEYDGESVSVEFTYDYNIIKPSKK